MLSNQKKPTEPTSFKRALNRSLLLHAVLIVIVIARVAFPSSHQSPQAMGQAMPNDNPMPIQAAVVDSQTLDEAVERKKAAAADAAKKIADAKAAAEKAAAEKALALKKKADAEKKLVADKAAALKKKADAEKKLAADKAAAATKQKAEAQKKVAAEKAAADTKLAAQKATAEKKAAADALAKALEGERMPPSGAGSTTAALSGESLREIDRYKLMVQQQIMRNWFVQGVPATGVSTQLFVRVAPNGTVLDVKISRSSGNDALDRSAMAAVFKASPLPVPTDPTLFNSFRELRLTLRPDAISEG